eukprot:CAMPEP_0172455128 /NCGR_PEP_ID=MMETSP1065-20121228/11907_1 /TAXON_ID=265537 /ORGANISM="Amphiprora paludosa, Strain CCMP125" /LENGTH=221 /DNA_ID=CAMNT_0013207583 /DNA_START=41 /DNA_END=706 /DNA_ORIENTATION=+
MASVPPFCLEFNMSRLLLILAIGASYCSLGSAVSPDAFRASLHPFGVDGTSQGEVTVFVVMDDTLAFSGSASGLATNLDAAHCQFENGCGVQVYPEAKSCEEVQDVETTTNPWRRHKYTTNEHGVGSFDGIVKQKGNPNMGLLTGHPFVLRDTRGTVVACGLLEPIVSASSSLNENDMFVVGLVLLLMAAFLVGIRQRSKHSKSAEEPLLRPRSSSFTNQV